MDREPQYKGNPNGKKWRVEFEVDPSVGNVFIEGTINDCIISPNKGKVTLIECLDKED